MKKLSLTLVLFALAQCAFAQQFTLPIKPAKMWPSDYAKYEGDVMNCCNYLLGNSPEFTLPKRQACAEYLEWWCEGTPKVKVVFAKGVVDTKNMDLLAAYMAAWVRYALQNPDDGQELCAHAAVRETIRFYEAYKTYLGTSKVIENQKRLRKKDKLNAFVNRAIGAY